MEIFVNDLDRHCTSFIIDAFCSCYIVYISDSLAAAVHVAAVPAVPCPSRFALAVSQFSGSIPSLLYVRFVVFCLPNTEIPSLPFWQPESLDFPDLFRLYFSTLARFLLAYSACCRRFTFATQSAQYLLRLEAE